MPRITLICPVCRKEFLCYQSADRTFCSRVCMSRLQRPLNKRPGYKHGGHGTRLYHIWCGMKDRCNNPNSLSFSYYGGRGIIACEEWSRSFVAFREWATGSGYAADLELDRRDNNGNYEPSNCRWVTRSQQMLNTRKRSDNPSSKYRGVYWCVQSKKWRVQISGTSRASKYIGVFDDEIEAAKAFDRVAIEERGEFAVVNFQQGG